MSFLDQIMEFLTAPTIPMACPSLNREITGYYERDGKVKWRYTHSPMFPKDQ